MTVLTIATAFTNGPADFLHASLYLRGIDKKIVVQTSPSVVQVQRPQTLNFTNRVIANGSAGPSLVHGQGNLAFQPARTVEANNSGKTVQEVLDALVSGFEARDLSSRTKPAAEGTPRKSAVSLRSLSCSPA